VTAAPPPPGPGALPRLARDGRFILCEEAARDGAQGKTLLLAGERCALFARSAAVLGAMSDAALVAMVGFPGIGKEEVDVIAEVIARHRRGYQQVVCRSRADELRGGVDLVRPAHAGRVLFVLPASAAMAGAMLHESPAAALARGRALLAGALDHAAGEVSVDVCLADISAADPGHVADAANALTADGAELIMLADTVGRLQPVGHHRLLAGITAALDPQVVVHCHFHNDLGLALALNLQALGLGHRAFGTSWLGLGERTGLGHTEELLAALATASEDQLADLGTSRARLGVDLWDAHQIAPTAGWLSGQLGLPRRATDPFVGGGVNAISTGTPFVDPAVFQPYDALGRLGIPARVDLTHLASDRVVDAVARAHGLSLSAEDRTAVRLRVKALAYARGVAFVDPREVLPLPPGGAP